MATLRLLISTLRFRKARSAMTIAAIALAVSLVVAITTGYASLEAAIDQFITFYLGSNSITIMPGDLQRVIPQELVRQLEADPEVSQVCSRLQLDVPLGDAKGEPLGGHPAMVEGVQIQDPQIRTMQREAGDWFTPDSRDVAVIDQVAAERLKARVGDGFTLLHPDGPLKLRIVGIIHKPAILAMQMQSIYIPLDLAQTFSGRKSGVSRIQVFLREGTDERGFLERWQQRLEDGQPALRLRKPGDRRRELQRNLQAIRLLSYLGGAISMLAASFIVFATLSMGVAERTRSLAMLRAVGALRWQIGLLVIVEGSALASIGAAAGIPLGLFWMRLLAAKHADLFTAGVSVSFGGILFGGLGMLITAGLASFLPAWNAMRVAPLDAMSPLGRQRRPHLLWLCAAVAILIIGIDRILMSREAIPRNLFVPVRVVVMLPLLFAAFFLLSPLVVGLVERLIGPAVAFLLRLDFSLLRQQLTVGIWRAGGTVAALMVGLTILLLLHTQGNAIMSTWRLPTKFPDVFIVAPLGLDERQQKILDTVPGILPGRVLPFAIASPRLGGSVFSLGGIGLLPDATMFFGVDPERTLRAIELDYREGNVEDAISSLKKGRHILVTAEFCQVKNLHIGDRLTLKTPVCGPVDYTIAGVVWSPGLDVVVSIFDMSRFLEQPTLASVFGSLADARRDFGIERIHLFAADLEPGIDREVLTRRMSDHLERESSEGNSKSETPDPTRETRAFAPGDVAAMAMRRLLRSYGLMVGDVRHIKHRIEHGFGDLLLLISTLALAAILIASLGVANTIMASIRGRTWELGILRSVGLTRGQLLRLILAEALLLGVAACLLGSFAAYILSIDEQMVHRMLMGWMTTLSIPWPTVGIGIAIVMVVTLIASFWPALATALKAPLELLQWGRSSA